MVAASQRSRYSIYIILLIPFVADYGHCVLGRWSREKADAGYRAWLAEWPNEAWAPMGVWTDVGLVVNTVDPSIHSACRGSLHKARYCMVSCCQSFFLLNSKTPDLVQNACGVLWGPHRGWRGVAVAHC